MLSYDLLRKHLDQLNGSQLETFVRRHGFKLSINDERITTIDGTESPSPGKVRHILRANVEEVLRRLVRDGRMTKDEMENVRGVKDNKATKLFAIIAYAYLPGVTATDNPRTLTYRART
jgi:hypothetical protein